MPTPCKIVALLGDMLFDKDYFFDEFTQEVFYWDGDIQVTTSYEDFINQAFEKWSKTPTK